MTSSTQKKIWRQKWLGSINELTSLGLQEASWLDPENGNPHWSFVEFTSTYFDDLLVDYEYDYFIKNGYVSQQEFQVINDWHNVLSEYRPPNEDPYDHALILSDPRWVDIVKAGNIAKQKLEQILVEEERGILTKEINVA